MRLLRYLLRGIDDTPTGVFTVKSLKDYLTILSVFQTCAYQDEQVWNFLVAGRANFTFPEPVTQDAMA
jgi:hypothetical protein